jgi:hypothetical protein
VHSGKQCFDTSVSALLAFAVTFQVLANICPFRKILVTETGKSWTVKIPGCMTGAQKPSHYAWQDAFE